MLLIRTTQPIYDAARDAKGPAETVEESEDVGQITSSIGNSLVHEETRIAVEIALGDA